MSARKRKRLNHDDRVNILSYLILGYSVPQIAERMGWAPSTIYREIKRNPQIKRKSKRKKKCIDPPKKCYVCNQCPKHANCSHEKTYYNLKMAIDDAHRKKHDSHRGPRVTEEQMALVDKRIREGTRNGQSLEYIYHFNADIHFVSCLTIRRWIENGLLSTKRAQLRRARRYTKKYRSENHVKCPDLKINTLKLNRTYTDFLDYTEGRDDFILVELDSVEGTLKSKSMILTMMFVSSGFQIGRKYEKEKASGSVLAHVTEVLRCIMPYVGEEKEVILLSDNGKEFSSLPLVEKEDERIRVFYTNPYKATDKPHCERNHEYFRYVCPKGNSFDDWTQEEIDSIFSNINSYARNELNWKRPYDLFIEPFAKEAAKALGISEIDANDVDLASKF